MKEPYILQPEHPWIRKSRSYNGVEEGIPGAGVSEDVGLERRQEARERRSSPIRPLATNSASIALCNAGSTVSRQVPDTSRDIWSPRA